MSVKRGPFENPDVNVLWWIGVVVFVGQWILNFTFAYFIDHLRAAIR